MSERLAGRETGNETAPAACGKRRSAGADLCRARRMTPREGHVHMARNLSATENVEVWVTYFDVPPGRSPRVDAADPGNCGF
jgi:hypothetical protein